MFQNHYKVEVRCGHVGAGRYIPIVFPVTAESRQEAVNKVLGRDGNCKKYARVKISHEKAVVLNVASISHDEYKELKRISQQDEYLQVKCVQDQRAIHDLDDRIVVYQDKYAEYMEKRNDCNDIPSAFSGKLEVKNVRRFIRSQSECGRISIVQPKRHKGL